MARSSEFLAPEFLDSIRGRVTLSGVISADVKLTKAGREFKACCPFHGEKTPSFTVNDDKQFGHCFGCGWHGDHFSWLTQFRQMTFIDAVKELAARAGVDMPARSPAQIERAARAATTREVMDAVQAVFADQLKQAGAVMEYLAARQIDQRQIDRFGLGYARGGDGSLKGRGFSQAHLAEAGLIVRRDDGSIREQFHDRITVPIRDARGRLCGWGARVWPGRRGDMPKFVNSPQSPMFDKGRLLFALASPSGDTAAPLMITEGYFDVMALDRLGLRAVAPMGTALTEAQLQRAWHLHHCPVLMFDGDAAGLRATRRAVKLALPMVAPGRALKVALLPVGTDPDTISREPGGAARLHGLIDDAMPLADFQYRDARGEFQWEFAA